MPEFWQNLPVLGAVLIAASAQLRQSFTGRGSQRWHDIDLVELNREENFLRRLLAIRRDWMNNPIRLNQELDKLLQQYRMVPECINGDMELSTMISILRKKLGCWWLDANKPVPALPEAIAR